MKFTRFSVLSLLLVTALIAVSVCLVLERRRTARIQKSLDLRNLEVGHIDEISDDAVIRKLRCGSRNRWEYRLVLPEEHDCLLETMLGDPANPTYFYSSPIHFSGQYTVRIDVAPYINQPIHPSSESFSVFFLGTDENNVRFRSSAPSRYHFEMPWPEADSMKYRSHWTGCYVNHAAATFNGNVAWTFKAVSVEDEVVLFTTGRNGKYPIAGEDSITIRLVPKSKCLQEIKPDQGVLRIH